MAASSAKTSFDSICQTLMEHGGGTGLGRRQGFRVCPARAALAQARMNRRQGLQEQRPGSTSAFPLQRGHLPSSNMALR
jgi:hypothetical protein